MGRRLTADEIEARAAQAAQAVRTREGLAVEAAELRRIAAVLQRGLGPALADSLRAVTERIAVLKGTR